MLVYAGQLTVQAPSFFFGTKTYKDVWCVLHTIDIERKINPKIVLYEDESKVGTSSSMRVIYICEAVWNTKNTLEFSFSFLISKYRYVFITTNNESLRLWILHLCCVSKDLYDKKHLVGIDDQGKLDPDALTAGGTDGTVVLNTLYLSSADSSMIFYHVVADEKGDCQRIKLKGMYKLGLKDENIHIQDFNTGEPVVSWSLFEIKKYGFFHEYYFYLVAGQKATPNDGRFTFYTVMGQQIVEYLAEEADKIRVKYNIKPLGATADPEAGPSSQEELDPYSDPDKETASKIKPDVKPKPKPEVKPKPKTPADNYSVVEPKSMKKQAPTPVDSSKSSSKKKTEKEQEPTKSKRKDRSKNYEDPWENKNYMKQPPPNPIEHSAAATDQVEYAGVDKSSKQAVPREVKHTENYFPVDSPAPPIPPPVWETDPNSTESNNNVYDHFDSKKGKSPNPENVYGIASAKPVHHIVNVPNAENPYEDTNTGGAYEAVGYS
ncbi:uncharacterized protein LOC131955945 [Physella acuta]|uniref:uncharacterized protein LOC131955945 n=1 Tax=Physella acuta TaxID=109671 RepID=UPI0027DE2770|nr:uncharacterized protein LOC131955945 [Physella acuta]